MKKALAVAAAVVMVGAYAGNSMAELNYDVKLGGEYELYYYYDDTTLEDEDDNEHSFIEHELDLKFAITANDKVTIGGKMEYADSTLGDDDHRLGKDNTIDVETAYMKVKFDAVKFTAGKFSYALPCAFDGGYILDDEGTGVDFDFGMVSAGMLRAEDMGEMTEDKDDIFYVIANLGSDDMKIIPFAAARLVGDNSQTETDDGSNTFWLGSAFEMNAGSLNVVADLAYGSMSYSEDENGGDQAGFFLDMGVDMDMGSMTPTAFLIYGSGNDDDADESEVMPTISPDYEPLDVFGNGDANSGVDLLGGILGIGVGVKKMSFAENMTHDLILFYGMGTNDKDSGSDFTEEDTAMEIDFNTTYKLMKKFNLIFNIAYATADMDEDIHGKDYWSEGGLQLKTGLKFKF